MHFPTTRIIQANIKDGSRHFVGMEGAVIVFEGPRKKKTKLAKVQALILPVHVGHILGLLSIVAETSNQISLWICYRVLYTLGF